MKDKTSIYVPIPRQQEKQPESMPPQLSRITRNFEERREPPTEALAHAPQTEPLAAAVRDGFPDVAEISRLMIGVIGADAISTLAANPRLYVPVPNNTGDRAELSLEDWVSGILRTFVSIDGLHLIRAGLHRTVDEVHRQLKEIEAIRQQSETALTERDEKILALEQRLSDVNVQNHRLTGALNRGVPLTHLVDRLIGQDPRAAELNGVLREALTQPSESLGPFVAGLLMGWVEVKLRLADCGPDEDANHERLSAALRSLLGHISSLFIPERRQILSCVAACVSTYFTQYDFVSPEDRRHVDPMVHNAAGVGGQIVKEGVSFAVVRRTTRQTVVYADIRAE